LSKTLDARTSERIAITVAQVNGCDYCLSAHTYLDLNLAKISQEEIAFNREGTSGDPKAAAAVHFAASVAQNRGKVSDAEVANVRLAGYTDAQIIEIVSLVAENFLTNLLNNVAETDIDFSVVRTAEAR
jgi:AhpD family alkylhydroperoxidase